MATVYSKSNPEAELAQNDQIVSYREVDFAVKDLIDMRQVIQQKVEQVFSQSILWSTIMPGKIFNDLLSFVGDGVPPQPNMNMV